MNGPTVNKDRYVFDELRDPQRALQISQLSASQVAAATEYNVRIKSGQARFESCPCLCGNQGPFNLIASTDRFGLLQQSVHCDRCGLIFNNPRMAVDECLYFYGSDAYRKLYDGEGWTELYESRYGGTSSAELFSYVESSVPVRAGMDIVEIGAGGGWNLLPFLQKGANVTGIEYSPSLNTLGKAHGLNMVSGGIEKLQGHYDLILINHVLEHMHDPLAALRKIKEHLKPDGKAYVGVPNILNFDLSQFQNAHLYCFAPHNFTYFCRVAGFKVLSEGSAHGIHMYAVLGHGGEEGFLAGDPRQLNPCRGEVEAMLRKLRLRRWGGKLLRRLGLKS
jgi:2-polyprenyl-3-methyl-5-hydroxy-6-metoxy-1,4-benzoquinol methylase